MTKFVSRSAAAGLFVCGGLRFLEIERRERIHAALVRLADGDRAAMPLLVGDLWPVLLAFSRRRVRLEEAEDVAQEVLIKICARVADFDPGRADGVAWAFTIASYEVLTQRKREQRRKEAVPAEGELDAGVDPEPLAEEAMIEHEITLALADAVAALTGAERAVLGLEGAPTKKDTTRRKQKQRALDRLRTIWRRRYGQP